MKKIIIFFLVLVVGKGFGQTVIHYNDCSSSALFSSVSSDWLAGSFAPTYPTCTVSPTTGGGNITASMFLAAPQQVVSMSINTATFVNIVATWNMYRATSSSPAIAFEWSNDGGASWNALSYTAPAPGIWGVVPTISLPAAASGTIINVRFSRTTAGSTSDFVTFDDLTISGTPYPSYYWDGVNSVTLTSSWGTNTNGTGANPPNFTNNNQNFYLMNSPSATLTSNWNISGSSSVLNIGDGSLGNSIAFTIPSSFALNLSGAAKINVTNNSTLNIQNNTLPTSSSSDVQFGTNSTMNFAQTSGTTTIWPAIYGNLVLSGGGVKQQDNTGSTAITNSFFLQSGTSYAMSFFPVLTTQFSGPVVCNGTIIPNSSQLIFNGPSSNSIGTLNFASGGSIAALTLARAGQTLVLGTDLSISGLLGQTTQLTNGNVSLNGKLLTINGPIVFPTSTVNGVFIGSSTSSISIGGSGTITNDLNLDQTNTASKTTALTLNRSSSNLVLGSDVVFTTAVFTNGNLNLNGKTINFTGPITFPSSTGNGAFIGSNTSNLILSGSGNITNSLLMSQTNLSSRSLGNLTTIRNLAVLPLGNNLVVAGTASLIGGIIDVNGTLLTLSGPIVFPTNATNKGFRGSLTSSLTIDNSGAINGSLFMNTSNILLNELTLNRSGETLTLGNTLETYGTVYTNAGTLASAGNLFIRSNLNNKGRLGPVLGTVSGSIKVETFAQGGTTDWANLGVSGVQGRTLANWDGQIPMSCSGCINSETSAGGYFVSVQGWDETAAASSSVAYVEANSATALTPGKGFWVYLGDNAGTTGNITWTVTGSAEQGAVNIPLSYSGPSNGDGMNLISNPYPSPISWNSVLASNPSYGSFMDDAIYGYNADVVGGTTSFAFNVSSHPNGIGNEIPMGQGFYVQAVTSGTLVMQESNKVASNTQLLKTTNDFGSVVRLTVDGAGFFDATAIRFHQDATPDFDRKMDAKKLYASPGYLGYPGTWTQRTTISTLSNDKDYSINSLPYAQSADAIIPVLVKVYASGQHTITGTDLENLPNSCVELKDKLLNVTHNLKSGGYVCNISDTTTTPRFELRICMDVAMSVDENKSLAADNSIVINNDENGMYVKFDYKQATKSKISVTNVLGQKIVDDKSLTTINDKVYLNLDAKQQIVFITVSNENQRVSKKVVR